MNTRFLLFALCVVFTLPARAALTVALAPAVQNSARGGEIVFAGTLTNTSATEKVFLNDLQATLSGGAATHLTLRTNDFFANVPGILLPGESYTGPVFRVVLASAAPAGDYAGSIMLQGGADIFAAADLAGAGFMVLSPAVGIVASDAEASESGPDAGAFTLTRSGGTDIALDVPLTISGTGVNGATYTLIASPVTIPAGAAAAIVAISPLPDTLAQGDRLVTLTLNPAATYNAGLPATATVTVHDKPVDEWRFAMFGAAANTPLAADAADPDGDGYSNLFEYAAGLSPTDAASTFTVRVEAVPGESGRRAITFSPVVAGRTYLVKSKDSLAGPTWTALGSFTTVDSGGERTVTDLAAGDGPRFYEVEITRP